MIASYQAGNDKADCTPPTVSGGSSCQQWECHLVVSPETSWLHHI